MTDFHEFEIAYAAPMTILPPRARVEKQVSVVERVRVRIPEIARDDAPVVIDARDYGQPMILHKAGGAFHERYHNAGLLRRETTKLGVPLARLAQKLGDPASAMFYLRGDSDRPLWTKEMAKKAIPMAEVMGSEILRDGRDAVLNRVLEEAERFSAWEGHVLRRAPEPYLGLSHSHVGDLRAVDLRLVKSGRHWGPAFRLDRQEALLALADHWRGLGFEAPRPREGWDLKAIDAAALDFPEDRHNARFALGVALHEAGQFMLHVSPEAYRLMGEAKRLFDGLPRGPVALDPVFDVLDRLGREVPRIERTRWFHAGLSLGIRALDLSLPSLEHGPVDDDDHDALQGLGPGM